MTQPSPPHVPQHVTIITGASRGLGRAMAQQRLARGDHVLTLQRRPDPALATAGGTLEQWACDLSAPAEAAQRLAAWIAAWPSGRIATLTLINNAAGLARPAPLSDSDANELATALRLGLEAPVLLTSAFLRASAQLGVPRRVLNISSGLGRRAMASSALYGATKAGLDHLSRAVAMEESARPNGARIVSLAPGVIDTDMQTQLRSADPLEFPEREAFVGLKNQGLLASPEAAAARVLAYLDRADFGSKPVADVRDAD